MSWDWDDDGGDQRDRLGPHLVDYEIGVPVHCDWSRKSEVLTTIPRGTLVDVVEVSGVLDDGRVRARIAKPAGWISLRDKEWGGAYVSPSKSSGATGHVRQSLTDASKAASSSSGALPRSSAMHEAPAVPGGNGVLLEASAREVQSTLSPRSPRRLSTSVAFDYVASRGEAAEKAVASVSSREFDRFGTQASRRAATASLTLESLALPGATCRILRSFLDVDGKPFNYLLAVVIISNSVIIGMETHYGHERFKIVEHVYQAIYMMEMCLRIRMRGGCLNYLARSGNGFDAFLVGVGALDIYVLPLFHGNDFLRKLKLLRLLRIMRLARIVRMFHSFNLMLICFINALQKIAGVALLFIIFIYVLGIGLAMEIGHDAESWQTQRDRELIDYWFGTVGRSMKTLCIIVTLQGWDQYIYTVSRNRPPMLVLIFFMSYIMVAAYGMVSLITGIVNEEYIRAHRDDEDERTLQLEETRIHLVHKLRSIMEEADVDRSGCISHEELLELMSEEHHVFTKLATAGIELSREDLIMFFEKLQTTTASPDLPINVVVDGLLHMSGDAKASHITSLKHNLGHMANGIDDQFDRIEEKLACLLRLVGGSESDPG